MSAWHSPFNVIAWDLPPPEHACVFAEPDRDDNTGIRHSSQLPTVEMRRAPATTLPTGGHSLQEPPLLPGAAAALALARTLSAPRFFPQLVKLENTEGHSRPVGQGLLMPEAHGPRAC